MLDPFYVNLSYLTIAVGRPDWLSRARLMQVSFFAMAVIVLAHFWGITGVALAANLMMLSGTLVLVVYSRRFVSFSLLRMFLWPVVAMVASMVIGYSLIQDIQWTGLWWALILKLLSISGIYVLILYLTERQIIYEYGSQILQPLWNQFRTQV